MKMFKGMKHSEQGTPLWLCLFHWRFPFLPGAHDWGHLLTVMSGEEEDVKWPIDKGVPVWSPELCKLHLDALIRDMNFAPGLRVYRPSLGMVREGTGTLPLGWVCVFRSPWGLLRGLPLCTYKSPDGGWQENNGVFRYLTTMTVDHVCSLWISFCPLFLFFIL